jgi:hypothetical protein
MAAIGAGDAITTSNNTIYINGVGANAGDVLTWNGTAWGHAAPTGGGGGGVSLSTPNTWTAPQTFNAPVQPLVVQSQIPDTVNRSGLLSFLGPANVPPGQMANNGSQEWTIGIPQPSSPLSFAIRPPGATSNALGINVSANVAYVSIPNLTASTLGVAQLNAGRINSPGSVNFWGSPDPASGLPQIYELDLSTGTDFTVDLAPVYNAVFNAGGPYTAQLLLTNLNNVANSNIRITISQPDFVGPPASVGGIDTFIGMVTLPAFEPGAQMPMSDGPPIIWGGSGFFPSSSPAAATSDFIQLTVWGSDPLYTNNPNKFVVSGKFSTASSGRGTLPSSTDIFGTGTAGQTVKWITSPAAGWVAGWIFQPIRKGQATTLTSNATLTPDPHLSVMATPTMNKFEVFVGISNAGATGMTPGFQFQMNFGGTLTNNNVNGLIYEISYVGSPTISGGLALNTPSGGIGLANGASNWLHITGTVTAATSGWLSFQWAQATADAAGVTVLPGSYLIITPLQ